MTDHRDHGDECPCDEHGAADIAETIRLIEYELLNRRTGGPGDDAVVRRVEVARLITALRQGEADRARLERDLNNAISGIDQHSKARLAAEAQLAEVTKALGTIKRLTIGNNFAAHRIADEALATLSQPEGGEEGR